MIRLLFQWVLHGAASFRSASACLKLLAEFLPGTDRTPTAWCGELWIWRIGLYEILRVKEPAEDRVWIVDHTVQIGTTKCLVIVRVRLSWWRGNQAADAADRLGVSNAAQSEEQSAVHELRGVGGLGNEGLGLPRPPAAG